MNNNKDIQLQKAIEEDEQIAQYLQGEMTADEETVFLEELKRNDDFRERAVMQAMMIKGMRQIDDEIAELCEEDTKETAKTVTLKMNVKRILTIAASVVLIFFVGFKSYDYYDTTNLGKEYVNTFPTSTIIRGEANANVENELATLFNNVVEGKDLDNTTSRLATLWELSKQESYNDYTDYSPYIGWNLAIGYLENYEKAKAKEILKEMKQVYPEGTALGDKIREVLNR